MLQCEECEGSNFTLEDAIKICVDCGTQQKEYIELEVDDEYKNNVDANAKFRTKSIFDDKSSSDNSVVIDRATEQNETTFELFNLILVEWTNILIAFGCTSKLRIAVQNLYFKYLEKRKIEFHKESRIGYSCEVNEALTKRDLQELKNIKLISKRKEKRKSLSNLDKLEKKINRRSLQQVNLGSHFLTNELSKSFLNASTSAIANSSSVTEEHFDSNASIYEQSFRATLPEDEKEDVEKQEEELDRRNPKTILEKNRVRIFYPEQKVTHYSVDSSPLYLIFPKLLCFIYLAVRICDEPILASDLLRWCRQGKLPYYSAVLLFEKNKIKKSESFIFNYDVPFVHQLLQQSFKFAQFLELGALPLCSEELTWGKYFKALNLPDETLDECKNLLPHCFPSRSISVSSRLEVLLASFILLSLKIFFCLDDQHELILSEATEKINIILQNNNVPFRLFSFRRWQTYMNKMVWWVEQVDCSKTKRKNTDCQRLVNDYWTRSFWESVHPSESTGSWHNKLMEKLLRVNGSDQLKDKVEQKDLFRAYGIPFMDLVDQYIDSGYDEDTSSNKENLLKIAKDLKAESFKCHRMFWLYDIDLLNQELKNHNISIEIVKIPLFDREKSYKTFFKESEECVEGKVFIPDPFESFCPSEVDNKTIVVSHNFQWLTKLLSSICEASPSDFFDDFKRLEQNYLKRVKSLSKLKQ